SSRRLSSQAFSPAARSSTSHGFTKGASPWLVGSALNPERLHTKPPRVLFTCAIAGAAHPSSMMMMTVAIVAIIGACRAYRRDGKVDRDSTRSLEFQDDLHRFARHKPAFQSDQHEVQAPWFQLHRT